MSFLEVRGLSKRFGGLQAVDTMDFGVNEGEILSVIGPNGAGKSTLFKMIAGAMRPTSGQVMFQDQVLTGRPEHEVARRGVVRTFQETTIFRGMSVLDHVVVANHLQAKAGLWASFLDTWNAEEEEKRIRTRARDTLEFLGLGAQADEGAENLPHGHLRALGIAMALAVRPKLLLLDEPFAGMNPEETDQAVQTVRKIRDRGTTVLLVEHDMRAVMKISDRIVAVSFGRKLAEGTPLDIQNDPRVIEAYLGRRDDELGV